MSETTENKGVIYEFGKFVLDPHERALFADGKAIHLTDKVFDTLLLLIRHNGRLLTKEEMIASIWAESYVEESNLAKNVSRLRKILNTDGGELIETLPRRGYRFLADVNEISGETSLLVHRRLRVKITQTDDDPALAPAPNPMMIEGDIARSRWKTRLLALGATAAAALVIAGLFFWKHEATPLTVPSENGAIRLTDNPKDDKYPHWTKDGRIRFLRTDRDRQAVSIIMNADGTNQTEVKDFNNLEYGVWSPDDSKVLFAKRGDTSAYYLADANGGHEIALPFFSGNLSWSSDSEKIVYQKRLNAEDADIFVYTLKTGKSENVTNDPAFDADPSFSPDGKQIVFASLRDGNAEVYLMNSDGSDVRRLTNHPAWDNHPVFSPDGTTIAFDSDRESENSHVYLVNVDGSNIRQLADGQTNAGIEPGGWSPDGTRIAFTSDSGGNEDIFVVSAEIYRLRLVLADESSNLQVPSYSSDGKQIVYQAETEDGHGELRVFNLETNQIRVVQKTYNTDLAPVLSPDGEWIAFQNKIESNTEICLIKTDGSGLKNLTQNPARDVYPAWSPDGNQIIFASNRDGNYGIYNLYLMNTDGSNQHQIWPSNGTSGMSLAPAWSPDGKQIVFTNDKADGGIGNFEIFKIELDTAESEKRLTFRRRADSLPAVSPDGKYIVFASNTDGNSEIYVMNSDGTGQVRITRNAGEDSFPRWSPDGKRIIFASNRAGKYAIYEISLADN